jgi:hypothetical protein
MSKSKHDSDPSPPGGDGGGGGGSTNSYGGGYFEYGHTNWMNFFSQSNKTINVGWPADAGDAPSLPGGFLEYLNGALYATNDSASVATYWGWVGHSHGSGAYTDGGYASDPLSWTADTESVPEVYAGGMALRQVKVLLKMTCPSLIWWLNGGLEDADYQENIPPQEVAWGSLGTPDENGVLYTALAAGQRETIRPQANYPNYSSAIGVPTVQDITPVIMANGTALSNNAVVAGANFCVGQNVQFTLSLPAGETATNFQWSFGGTYFNTQSNAVPGALFPTCSTMPYVDGSLLNNNTSTNWWASGGANNDANTPAAYQASVTCDLIFANGNPKQSVSASGLFNMFRPAAMITTKTGTIGVDSNYFLFTNIVTGGVTNEVPGPNIFALHFGISSNPYGTYSTNGAPGIVFSNSITYPSDFAGKVKWVQVVSNANNLTRHASNLNYAWDSPPALDIEMPMLDSTYPYPSDPGDPTTEDSPAQTADPSSVFSGVSSAEEFSMWLMFRADAGDHDVPLCKVDWNWSALGTISESGTNWELLRPDNTVNPSGHNCTVSPYWEANANIMTRH